MTKSETAQVLAILKAAYPHFYRNASKQDALTAVNLWHELFADDPEDVVAAAVKALIATDEKGYPPHIGAVKAKMRQLTRKPSMTDAEAWAKVMQAIRQSGYSCKSEFDKLPEDLQDLVGSPSQLREWGMMDTQTLQSVVSSNFQRSYRERKRKAEEYAALPEDIKRLSAAVIHKIALETSDRKGIESHDLHRDRPW